MMLQEMHFVSWVAHKAEQRRAPGFARVLAEAHALNVWWSVRFPTALVSAEAANPEEIELGEDEDDVPDDEGSEPAPQNIHAALAAVLQQTQQQQQQVRAGGRAEQAGRCTRAWRGLLPCMQRLLSVV